MKRVKYDVRDLTDATLARAKAGDRAAIAEVFRAVSGLVRWRAGTYRSVDADTRDDLISIGNLAVFSALRTYKPGKGAFAPWVTQWIHARMYTEVRSKGRRATYLEEFAEHQKDPEMPLQADEALEAEDESLLLRRFIASMSPRLRNVMQGRLRGGTLEQVGKQLSLTREAARLRELRAVELLRKRFKGAA